MTDHDDSATSTEVNLAAPGAGLPAAQAFFLRHVLFPAFCLVTPWDKAVRLFLGEGERVAAAAGSLTAQQLGLPVLVRAPMGIEDSSRYWSAAMVLEHLIEVGSRISTGVVELMQSRAASVKADIADVKPKGLNNEQIVSRYRSFLTEYETKVMSRTGDRRARNTQPHPWFGELNPHQWVCLGAIHQQIHRRQLERIIAGLQRML